MNNEAKKYLQHLRELAKIFYPLYYNPDTTQSIPTVSQYKGIGRMEFLKYLLDITHTQDISDAVMVLEHWLQDEVAPTVPPEINEMVEKLEEIEKAPDKDAQAKAKQSVERDISTLKANLASRLDKEGSQIPLPEQVRARKVYSQPEVKPPTPTQTKPVQPQKVAGVEMPTLHLQSKDPIVEIALTAEDKARLGYLVQAVNGDGADPDYFIELMAKEIVDRVPTDIKNSTSADLLRASATLASTNLAISLYGMDPANLPDKVAPAHFVAMFNAFANPNDPEMIKAIPNAQMRMDIASLAREHALMANNDIVAAHSLLGPVLGERLAPALLGTTEVIGFHITPTQTPNTLYTLPLDRLNETYTATSDERRQMFEYLQNNNQDGVADMSFQSVVELAKQTPWYEQTKQRVQSSATSGLMKKGILPMGGAYLGGKYFYSTLIWNTQAAYLYTSASQAYTILPSIAGRQTVFTFGIQKYFQFGPIAVAQSAALGGNIGQSVIGLKLGSASATITKTMTTTAGKTAAQTVVQITTKSGTKVIGGALAAKIGALAGAVVPFLGHIVGAAIGWVAPKVISWIKRHKEDMAILGSFGLIILSIFSPIAILGPVLAVLGILGGIGFLAMKAGGIKAAGGIFAQSGHAVMLALTTLLVPAMGIPMLVAMIALPIAVTLILIIINSGAYVVPAPGSLLYGAYESPYIRISKTANPSGPFENSVVEGSKELEIEYTIKIAAKKDTLSNIRISDRCEVLRETNIPNCPSLDEGFPDQSEIPDIISPAGGVYEFKIKMKFNNRFTDSLIANTVTVTADVPDQSDVSGSATANVIIGEPPVSCPTKWPLQPERGFDSYPITQGPDGTASHNLYGGYEAIDVGTHRQEGFRITATHKGVVKTAAAEGWNHGWGKYVDVESVCGGKSFISRYSHLSVVEVNVGQTINYGDLLGLSGNTGNSTGAHLHYDFRDPDGQSRRGPYPDNPPFMHTPYIPVDVTYGCPGNCGTVEF